MFTELISFTIIRSAAVRYTSIVSYTKITKILRIMYGLLGNVRHNRNVVIAQWCSTISNGANRCATFRPYRESNRTTRYVVGSCLFRTQSHALFAHPFRVERTNNTSCEQSRELKTIIFGTRFRVLRERNSKFQFSNKIVRDWIGSVSNSAFVRLSVHWGEKKTIVRIVSKPIDPIFRITFWFRF